MLKNVANKSVETGGELRQGFRILCVSCGVKFEIRRAKIPTGYV